MNRKKLTVLTALFALLLIPLTVFAAPPVITSYSFTIEYPTGFCGDDILWVVSDISGTRTTFFDNQGNEVREQVHENFEATITNTGTGDYVIATRNANFVSYPDGSWTSNGINTVVTDPVTNDKLLHVGKIGVNPNGDRYFLAGPKEVWNEAFPEAIAWVCAATTDGQLPE